jgi:glycosyltransferase involved in cell wall biosynthesis
MPAVSVLTPVYNRPDDLVALAAGLETQTCRDFEWIIVDDGSDVPVDTFLHTDHYRFPITIVRHETNRGIGAARNRAVDAAAGDLILWLDSDSAPGDAGWLAGHVQTHQTGLPELGIAAGEAFVLHSRIVAEDTSAAGTTFRYSNWFISCQEHSYRITRHHAPTNNTSLPRSILDRVGPFDPQFEVAEDIDWGLRALADGVTMAYVPHWPAYHRDRDTFGEVWRSYRKMGRFAALVRRKNPASPNAWLYPASPLWATLWALPFALLLSFFTVRSWFPREKKVLLYLPALFFANLANSVGMIDAACHGRAAPPAHGR